MNIRFALSTIAVGLSGLSHASYELLMQIDLAASGGPMVRRFDPVSGSSFGSFGQGYLHNPQSIAYRNGVLYVLDYFGTGNGAGRIVRFNPSTGEPLGAFSLGSVWGKVSSGSGMTITPSGTFLISDATNSSTFSYVNEYAVDGSYLFNRYWFLSNNHVSRAVAFNAAANRVYLSDVTGGTVEVFNYSSGTSVSIQSVGAPNWALFSTIIGNYLYYSSDVQSGNIYRYQINGDGSLGGVSSFNPSNFAMVNTLGIGGGHSPFAYAAQMNGSGAWSYSRFNSITGEPYGSFGSGVMAKPWGNIEVITAPEPASALGLVLGVAAIAARRRRR